jgi:hypothetical protein
MIQISVENGDPVDDVFVSITDANIQPPGNVTNLGMIHPNLSIQCNVQEDQNGQFNITTITTDARNPGRTKNGGPFSGGGAAVVTVDLFGV